MRKEQKDGNEKGRAFLLWLLALFLLTLSGCTGGNASALAEELPGIEAETYEYETQELYARRGICDHGSGA